MNTAKSPAVRVLERLRGVRRTGDGWMALCPAHPDRSPSLSIREGSDGRVLLKCFAGCTVETICAALQIRLSDLFSNRQYREPVPRIVRYAERELTASGLRSRLTPRDKERPVTIVLADRDNPDPAFARALALAVEGELVQVAFNPKGKGQ